MYKIIGADQKEYGPISAEQIRQWIAEGRVNAHTQTCLEGTQEWKPLGMFPEFGLGSPEPGTTPGADFGAPVPIEEILARDYSLDIVAYVSRSWDLVQANFWPVVGVTFLIIVLLEGFGQLIGLISRPALNAMIANREFSLSGAMLFLGTTIIQMPVSTVLMGGLFRYYLKLIRRQRPTIGDAFSSFSDGVVQFVLLGFVQGILVWLGILLCVIPGVYLAVAWYFAILLIADREMNFWDAMELSRKMVSKHWFMVFGFMLVMGLLAAAGLIVCCVGVFVTSAVAFIAVTYAYETIFGRKTA